ncbi:hypothetical protein [uncultured Sphingobacterium sp.]|uniref:hypothetical protein n=1 Tax=uncultured Sphingobacterium sp. TaxID=182688 RepID=UPI0025D3BF97|nr:hypothetical protein [uncultured Sphingobacterium sp.]
MIVEKTMALNKKVRVWGVKLLLLLTLFSCSTKKNYNDWVDIDQNNCSSYSQQGKGYTDDETSPLIKGKVSMCHNNENVPSARVFFLSSESDTIGTAITDKNGEFSLTIPSEGLLHGKIIVDTFGTGMTIEHVYIAPNFKTYALDIKLPRQPMYINEIGSKKDQKKLRKEVEKANRKHK